MFHGIFPLLHGKKPTVWQALRVKLFSLMSKLLCLIIACCVRLVLCAVFSRLWGGRSGREHSGHDLLVLQRERAGDRHDAQPPPVPHQGHDLYGPGLGRQRGPRLHSERAARGKSHSGLSIGLNCWRFVPICLYMVYLICCILVICSL